MQVTALLTGQYWVAYSIVLDNTTLKEFIKAILMANVFLIISLVLSAKTTFRNLFPRTVDEIMHVCGYMLTYVVKLF